MVKNLPANKGDAGSIPGSGRHPGEGNGNSFQYYSWKILRTEKPGGLQSIVSQRVRQNLVTKPYNTIKHPHKHQPLGGGSCLPQVELQYTVCLATVWPRPSKCGGQGAEAVFSPPVNFPQPHLLCCCSGAQLSDSVTPWAVARQASLSFTISQSLLRLMSIESVMPSSHLILCSLLLFMPSVFPSIKGFSGESALRIRWPRYRSSYFALGKLPLACPALCTLHLLLLWDISTNVNLFL